MLASLISLTLDKLKVCGQLRRLTNLLALPARTYCHLWAAQVLIYTMSATVTLRVTGAWGIDMTNCQWFVHGT